MDNNFSEELKKGNPFRVQTRRNRIPKKRVLSSSAEIFLTLPNLGIVKSVIGYGTDIPLGGLTEFSPKAKYEEVKRWTPFGSNTEEVLLEFKGYDISFSSEKVDWVLSYLMYAQERLLIGEKRNNQPTKDGTYAGLESLGIVPVFAVKYQIEYSDGVKEAYIFKDLKITNYDFSISDNNSVIPEKFTAFSPERIIDDEFSYNEGISNIKDKVSYIVGLMNDINKT
jgi:hypothetical protein